jgi:electron transport complex protein RnfG
MLRHVLNLGLRLTLVCLVAALGLGLTYSEVKDRIAEMEREEREEAGREVLASLEAEPHEEPELLASLQGDFPDLVSVFLGVKPDGEQVGYAFVVKTKGYNQLVTAVGVDLDGRVSGVEVVKNEETPGIGGAAVESGDFMGQFEGKGPENLQLGVDVDAYSGATMTSKGITAAVNLALEIWRKIKESAASGGITENSADRATRGG